MKQQLPLLFLLLTSGLFACQNSNTSESGLLKGELNNISAEQVYLFSTIGHTFELIDSCQVNAKGEFHFPIEDKIAGFYKIALNDSDLVDLIINPKENQIKVSFDSIPLQEHITVLESMENRMLWEYKAVSREAQAKDVILKQQKFALPQTDSLGRLNLEFKRNQNQQWKAQRLGEITASNPDSYFAKITTIGEEMTYIEEAAPQILLHEIPYADPEFLRSTTYARALLVYLRAIPLDNENDFMRNLDLLLDETKANSECRNYTLRYFIDLFAQSGPEIAFQHVVSTHVTDSDMETIDPKLRERIRRIRKLGLGAVAPNVRLPDMRGDSLDLYSVVKKNKATCLFFYSSSCDHCHDQMPGLKVLYNGLKDYGFDVMGIALDTDTIEFNECIREHELPWPSYTEQSGWGSPAAKAFEIAATPSFYLLDDKMHIMAKPSSSKALMDILRRVPQFKDFGSEKK